MFLPLPYRNYSTPQNGVGVSKVAARARNVYRFHRDARAQSVGEKCIYKTHLREILDYSRQLIVFRQIVLNYV